MVDYFFFGNRYIRVSRGDVGPGSLDAGNYPAPVTNWNWGAFGANGIDAALYSGSKCYFFKGSQYIRVSRGVTGPGTLDHPPAPISDWNWGAFGANGIDAALWSGPVCYFFKDDQYIRVTRGDTGPGKVDKGYPASISHWNWGSFGANGIDGALNSGWGVQVNAYSASGDVTAQQQYVIYVGPNSGQLYAHIDNFINSQDELIRLDAALAPTSGGKMPAGSSLTITLTNDSGGNITGAKFSATDAHGNQIGATTMTIVGSPLRNGQKATAANLAPIVAFQYNLVGCYGGATANLQGGSGAMVYSADNALTVTNAAPSYVDQNFWTVETANCAYGPMPVGPSKQVCQFFWTLEAKAETTARARAFEAAHPDKGKRLPAPEH
jgi:hypothetical protein